MGPLLVVGIMVATVLLTGKPPAERITLLPGPDGSAGAVIVESGGRSTRLDQAWRTVEARGPGAVTMRDEDPAEIRARYAQTLAAMPMRPASWTVYFVFGTDQLAPESQAAFDAIKRELAARPAPEIAVVGHTDRAGEHALNDALSLRRAEAVRDALVAEGVAAAMIEVAGRGERDPLVETGDGVAEPRNRRVEISVR